MMNFIKKMKIFITGSSGFIGFSVSKKLLDEGHFVHGFDSMNNYYDVKLKKIEWTEVENISKAKKEDESQASIQ